MPDAAPQHESRRHAGGRRTASREAALVALLSALLLGGCGIQKRVAESAVTEVQVAYAGIGSLAENVAPDEARLIQDALAQAKDEFARGEFSATLIAARSIRNRVKELGERLPDRRAELETAWSKLDATIPGTLDVLDRKLRAASRPPAGAKRADFEASRTELDSLAALWSDAQDAKQLGRIAEAVNRAADVKFRALRLLDDTQDGS